MEEKPKHAGGRPSDYSDTLSYEICERLINGESLNAICRLESMPSAGTVYRWLDQNKEFRERYEKAREDQADTLADEMLNIADDGTNDWMERRNAEGEVTGWQVNGEHVQRSRLRLDTRKWIASKLKPKKYGEKTINEITGKDGGAIKTEDVSMEEAAKRLAFLFAAATAKKE